MFDYLRQHTATPVEIDLLTYAVFAFEKYQWFEQVEKSTGSPPNAVDIERWIADITPLRFSNMREEAARLFDATARRYLAPVMEEQTAKAINESILAEVKSAGSVWRQALIALIMAILAPVIIGGVIAAVLTYDRNAPSATEVLHRLDQPRDRTPQVQVPQQR